MLGLAEREDEFIVINPDDDKKFYKL